jgi:hypothetical protein
VLSSQGTLGAAQHKCIQRVSSLADCHDAACLPSPSRPPQCGDITLELTSRHIGNLSEAGVRLSAGFTALSSLIRPPKAKKQRWWRRWRRRRRRGAANDDGGLSSGAPSQAAVDSGASQAHQQQQQAAHQQRFSLFGGIRLGPLAAPSLAPPPVDDGGDVEAAAAGGGMAAAEALDDPFAELSDEEQPGGKRVFFTGLRS